MQHTSVKAGTGVGSALAQGLLLVVGVGSALRVSLGLGGSSSIRAVAVFGAVMTLVIRSLPANHPHLRFGAANHVTTIRAGLVSLLAGFVGEPDTAALAWMVVGLATIATALDGVDGWLARRSGLSSVLGARFDMEMDALLILVLTLLIWQCGKAGAWVILAGLLRYLFVAGGWLAAWMRQPLPPSRRRQAVCVAQIAALIVGMSPVVPLHVSRWLAATSVCALACSFGLDTAWLWRRGTSVRFAVPS